VIQDAPGVSLAAVVDPNPVALQSAGETPGYGSLEEALAGVECDAVVVSSPPETHHAVAKSALEAGKHVLCEKPLSTSLSDALDLMETARRANRIMMVSQNYRYNAPFRAVQRVISEGGIGDLISIEINFRRDTRNQFAPDDFRYSMRHPLVLDMAIHHFDLLRAVTGRDVRHIHACGWRAPDSHFAHHTEVAAVMALEDELPVMYRGTWTARGPETSWNGDWEIVGKEGRLFWTGDLEDRNVGEVVIERWNEPPRILDQPSLQFTERAATLQALRVAIETGGEPETAASDNVKSLAAVLGCVRSIEDSETADVVELLAAARRGAGV